MALTDFFRKRQPGLVIISGEPGIGRSHLLRALAEWSHTLGYKTVGWPVPIALDTTTTLTDIRRALAALLSDETAQDPQLGATEPHTDAFDVAPRRTLSHSSTDNEMSAPSAKWVQALQYIRARLTEDESILRILYENAPLLLAVDGYRPNGLIKNWIELTVLPRLRSSAQSVIVLIVGQPSDVRGLTTAADCVVDLKSLDTAEVEVHLQSLSGSFTPSLTPEEIRLYSQAAADDPSILEALQQIAELSEGWVPV